MSNIEYLRQLHHKNLNLRRAQFRVKEFYSYEKDLVCSVLRKGLDLYVQEKSLGFGRILMPVNKLLLIFIDDLNRLAFCENEA